jgi:hypothetical protein
VPPFPYWPLDRLEENARLLQQELQGKQPPGGIEVKVMRKDGSPVRRAHVRLAADRPKGQQTGWMTSMTNITEAKRIRDQLTASHERFTTVLEGLDAAVSVLSVQRSASCCSPTARTGSGSAPIRTATQLSAATTRARRIASTATRRSTTSAACRPRSSPTPAPTRASLRRRRCRSGSTCARATCSGPTAASRRC